MIGLDTCAIIDLFKGDEKIKEFLDNNNMALSSTILSYLELQLGIDPDYPKKEKERKYYDELFSKLIHFRLTTESCKKSSQIHWDLRKKGKIIDQFDCTIAAIFLTNGVKKILTRNKKHFENIEGIEVIEY